MATVLLKNRNMPKMVHNNHIVTEHFSDLLYVTSFRKADTAHNILFVKFLDYCKKSETRI